MAEHPLHVREAHAVLQKQAREGVAEVVRRVVRELRGLERSRERLRHVVSIEERPFRSREDPLGAGKASFQPHGLRGGVVPLEHVAEGEAHVNRARPAALGRLDPAAGDAAGHSHFSVGEVEVVPLKCEGLAEADTSPGHGEEQGMVSWLDFQHGSKKGRQLVPGQRLHALLDLGWRGAYAPGQAPPVPAPGCDVHPDDLLVQGLLQEGVQGPKDDGGRLPREGRQESPREGLDVPAGEVPEARVAKDRDDVVFHGPRVGVQRGRLDRDRC